MQYNISDVITYCLLSNRYAADMRETPYGRRYRALLVAFGIPLNWEEDQYVRRSACNQLRNEVALRLQRNKEATLEECNDCDFLWGKFSAAEKAEVVSSAQYMRYRSAAAGTFFHDVSMGGSYPLEQAIQKAFCELHNSLRASLLEIDIQFFGEAYGIDARRTFTDEELTARGATSTSAEVEYGADHM